MTHSPLDDVDPGKSPRWIDKLCFDQALQRLAPSLALGVFAVENAASLGPDHLLRQRFSRGAGSALWPHAMLPEELASVTRHTEYCAHIYRKGCAFFCNGVRFQDGLAITDAWRCHDKNIGARQLLCGVTPLLAEDGQYPPMLHAVEQAAVALAFPLGPFHVEGVLCDDGSVRLLKAVPRPAGFPLPALCERMGCLSQPVLAAQASSSGFARRPVLPPPSTYAGDFSFPIARPGKILALDGMEEIERLKSFASYAAQCRPGDEVAATQDELTYPITIWLEHADPRQLDEDAAACMRRLHQGIYRLA